MRSGCPTQIPPPSRMICFPSNLHLQLLHSKIRRTLSTLLVLRMSLAFPRWPVRSPALTSTCRQVGRKLSLQTHRGIDLPQDSARVCRFRTSRPCHVKCLEINGGTHVDFPGMDGRDRTEGEVRERGICKGTEAAPVVGAGVRKLGFQRDSRPEGIGAVERHAPGVF